MRFGPARRGRDFDEHTVTDLDAAFDMDIDAWMTEVFAIEPYSAYKQAFVVWKIRLPSNARVAAADPQTADTAFNLGMTTDGSGDNATVFGGNGNLRSNDRMCNFCREVTAFRTFERTGVIADPATSLDTWAGTYRTPFFTKFGFKVPTPVPQTSSDSKTWWMPCTP
jgi:hypothetical protein